MFFFLHWFQKDVKCDLLIFIFRWLIQATKIWCQNNAKQCLKMEEEKREKTEATCDETLETRKDRQDDE